MRVCSRPGCPNIFPRTESSRCAEHRQEARRARRATNDVYSSRGHQRFRNAVLQRDTICVLCENKQSTVADHWPIDRQQLVIKGLDPNDPARGRGLCAGCHNKHTAATNPGGWAAQ